MQQLSSTQDIYKSGLHSHGCKVVAIQDSYRLVFFKQYKVQFWFLLFSSNFIFLSEMPVKEIKTRFFFNYFLERHKRESDITSYFWKQNGFYKVRTILVARKQPDQKLWIQILQVGSNFTSIEAQNFYLVLELWDS